MISTSNSTLSPGTILSKVILPFSSTVTLPPAANVPSFSTSVNSLLYDLTLNLGKTFAVRLTLPAVTLTLTVSSAVNNAYVAPVAILVNIAIDIKDAAKNFLFINFPP